MSETTDPTAGEQTAESDAPRCTRCCGTGWVGTRHNNPINSIGHYHCPCGVPCAVDRAEGCTGPRNRDAAVGERVVAMEDICPDDAPIPPAVPATPDAAGERECACGPERQVERLTTCATCKRPGATWPHAYTTLDTTAEFPRYRTETRFVCDECEGE